MRTIALIPCCVAACLLVSPRAPADAPPSEPTAAERVFRLARKALEAGDHETACPMFAESLQIEPSPGALLNLAACDEHFGKLASAWKKYASVIEWLDTTDPRYALARSRAQDLNQRVPRLTLRMRSTAPPGSRIEHNGISFPAATLGVALPVDPGKHAIRIVAPGHGAASHIVDLREGARVELMLEPGPASTPPVARAAFPEVTPRRTPTPKLLPRTGFGLEPAEYVAGSIGLAGLSIGAITGALAWQQKSTVEAECGPDQTCSPRGLHASDTGATLANISTAAFTTGLVGAATCLTLVFTRSRRAPIHAAINPAPASVSVRTEF